MKEKTAKKRKRKLRGWTKVAIVALSLFLVVAIVMGVGHSVYMSYYNKMNYEETVTRTEFGRCMRRVLEGDMRELMYAEHVYNVLLIGTDSYKTNGARSDSMILVSVNESTEQIIMTSFMRDSWVYIPGIGAERLNEAFNSGGADLLIDTIETNFHIKIDNYILVDFYAFIDVVDSLGGVDIEITEEERLVLNEPYIEHLNLLLHRPKGTDYVERSGLNHFNGVQALSFARIRYMAGSDFARTERQRKVITAIFEKFKDCSISEMLEVVDVVLPNVTTNIDENTMFTLITNATMKYKDYEMVMNRVPYDDTYWNWINEVTGETKDVLSIDIEINTNYLIRDIYGVDLAESDSQDEEIENEK